MNDEQQLLSTMQNNNNINHNHINTTNNQHDTNSQFDFNTQTDDINSVFAKKLFEAYCQKAGVEKHLSSTLLSTLSSLLSSQPELTQPSIINTSTTTTSIVPTQATNITIQSIIATFNELRSQYIGHINSPTPTNNVKILSNLFATNDVVFNYSLFHTALLTSSPIIIDAIMPYINYDFTTLNISHDQIDDIKKHNMIYNYNPELYPNNYILQAIVDATEDGHYESIQHLINNYQLSATIPICDVRVDTPYGCTTLLYYSTHIKNLHLIEYLFPLCFTSTNQKVLSQSILNIAEYGHLHLIKQFHNEYNINLSQIQDKSNKNILRYAILSNNIELIDYLIEDLNLPFDEAALLQSTIKSYKWDIMKHLIIKYNINPELTIEPLHHAAQDPNITPDVIDYIITTFNIENDMNNQTNFTIDSPLYSIVKNCNIIAFKHLIEHYNANPHCLYYQSPNDDLKNNSLLHAALSCDSRIKPIQLLEMVTYLCELGLDVNQAGNDGKTPIELLVQTSKNMKKCYFTTFKLLLDYKAEIRNIHEFILSALNKNQLLILSYLITTHQSSIDINELTTLSKIPILHYIIHYRSSLELMSDLLSLNTININKLDSQGKSPILYAITSKDLNIDIVKLLIQNGANITIDDWVMMFGKLSAFCSPYNFFYLLDYLNNTYSFNIETFSSNQYPQLQTTPLLQFTHYQLSFKYSTIKFNKSKLNMVIIYRALIHHYKANVNDQDIKYNNNTVFHTLARYNHYELIQFTLLHSHYKPNIYLVNKQGKTFIHLAVSYCDLWLVDGIEIRNPSIADDELNDKHHNFEKVLDLIIDFL